MAAFKTVTRLREMYRRQDPFRFGPDYLAATRATRAEAPGRSRPSQLYAEKLGRSVHNLSIPERKANCLALYNPAVIEIHDQSLLWPTAHKHPLSLLRPNWDVPCPTFKGTLDVADRLGYLNRHPTLTYRESKERKTVPWPYQGDSLLFLGAESTYCVNWSVKAKRREFLKPEPGPKRLEARRRLALRARYEIEAQYYLDVDIRTQPITEEEIDDTVATNLIKLCCYSQREQTLNELQLCNLEDALRQGLNSGTPPSVTIARFVIAERCSIDQGKVAFYQSIWHRRLRPDLFKPVLIDRPLEPESTDVLEYYNDWFQQ